MKKLLVATFVAIFLSRAQAQEFVNFAPETKNVIESEMNGKKFHCFLGKDKWNLAENFNLGASVFIDVKAEKHKTDVYLQSPDNPKPHSLNIKRISAKGATFDASIMENGYLFIMSKNDTIFLEKVIRIETDTYQTEFVGFCNQIEEIPSEYDIVRMGYVFRMHDYCNKTRMCL